MLLASESYAKAHNIAVQAKVRHSAAAGGDPLVSPKSAILALNALLQRAGLSHTQIDCFELNEAFAVIDVMFSRAFPGHEALPLSMLCSAVPFRGMKTVIMFSAARWRTGTLTELREQLFCCTC